MNSLRFFVITLALLLSSTASAGISGTVMGGPIPLQDTIIYAEDIVSIIHPLVGEINFRASDNNEVTLEIDGREYFLNVGDFVLSPGNIVDLPRYEDFYLEGATFGGLNASEFKYPSGEARMVNIADVRKAMSGEAAIVPPIIFIDNFLNPYASLYPNLPATKTSPAFALTKIRTSALTDDIALVSFDSIKLEKIDGTVVEISSPIFYLKMTEEGIYRLSGILGTNRDPSEIKKNLQAIDIESLDINRDGREDLAVLNYHNHYTEDGEAYVLFFYSMADSWQDINDAYAWPQTDYKVSAYALDAAIVSDKVGDTWVDSLIVVPFSADKDGRYYANKFTFSPEDGIIKKTSFPIVVPRPVHEICTPKSRCGVVQIECTRGRDLDDDGCGDCVMTWGVVDYKAGGEADHSTPEYYKLFDHFSVYRNAPEAGGRCSDRDYEMKEISLSPEISADVLGSDLEDMPTPTAYAIEISDANLDGRPDIWIGDQTLYHNATTDDHDSFVYLFLNGETKPGDLNILDGPLYVKGYDANYKARGNYLLAGYGGGGVKAIVDDGFGNLGIVNGYLFMPYAMNPPRRVIEVSCQGVDKDLDEVFDMLPIENYPVLGNGTLTPDNPAYIDALIAGIRNGTIVLNCDTCVPKHGLDPILSDPSFNLQRECVYRTNCGNNQDQTFVNLVTRGEEALPEGCKTPTPPDEACQLVPKANCPSPNDKYQYYIDAPDSWDLYLMAQDGSTIISNDKDSDCIPDCAVDVITKMLTGFPCDPDVDINGDGNSRNDLQHSHCLELPDYNYAMMPDQRIQRPEATSTARAPAPEIQLDNYNRDYNYSIYIAPWIVNSSVFQPYLTAPPEGSRPALKSEATILLNNGAAKERVTPGPPPKGFCEEHPDDSQCKTPGGISPEAVKISMQQCSCDVDRAEGATYGEYAGGIEYIRKLNDKFREITGLKYDPFFLEYASMISCEIYRPVSEVWYSPDKFAKKGAEGESRQMVSAILQTGGAETINYRTLGRRPNYLSHLVTEPRVLLPTAGMITEAGGKSLQIGMSVMPDESVQNIASNTYLINGVMEVTVGALQNSVLVKGSSGEALLSPEVDTIRLQAPIDGCAWPGPECPDAIPPRSVRGEDPKAFLAAVEQAMGELSSKGIKPSPERVIERALEISPWDTTGWLVLKYEFGSGGVAESKALLDKAALTPAEGYHAIMANIAAAEKEGLGCGKLYALEVPMDNAAQSAAGCKCNMTKRSLTTADWITCLLFVLSAVGLYAIRKMKI